jgi:predicted aminopeptidase
VIRLLLLLPLLAWLGGCETLGYYKQGIGGQLAFYGAREPIVEVLASADLAAETRRKLELVPQITAFARNELQLPVKGQYQDYVQLDRPVVMWSVFAAPSLSLEAYQWCYGFHLICVEYRGYFREADARRYAAKLAAQGYDVHIGGVSAFSSLGLFDDPVTSVLTSYPDDLLASVLFHELAHSVIYVSDDTAFNESFASAVADEGMARWRVSRGAAAHSGVIEGFRQQQKILTEVALGIRKDLAALYASPLDDAAKRAQKADILAGAAERYRVYCRDVVAASVSAVSGAAQSPARESAAVCTQAHWFTPNADGSGLNNARLNAVATYEHLVPSFAALIRAHGGDLAAFYVTVEELADMPRAQRDQVLRAMQPSGNTSP